MLINFELKKKEERMNPDDVEQVHELHLFHSTCEKKRWWKWILHPNVICKKKINGTFFSSQTSILISSAFHMQFSFKFTTSQYTNKSWPIFCCKAWRLGASAEFKREWKKKQLSKEIDPSRRKYFFFPFWNWRCPLAVEACLNYTDRYRLVGQCDAASNRNALQIVGHCGILPPAAGIYVVAV